MERNYQPRPLALTCYSGYRACQNEKSNCFAAIYYHQIFLFFQSCDSFKKTEHHFHVHKQNYKAAQANETKLVLQVC